MEDDSASVSWSVHALESARASKYLRYVVSAFRKLSSTSAAQVCDKPHVADSGCSRFISLEVFLALLRICLSPQTWKRSKMDTLRYSTQMSGVISNTGFWRSGVIAASQSHTAKIAELIKQ